MTMPNDDLERRFLPDPDKERADSGSPFHGQPGRAFQSRRDAARYVMEQMKGPLAQFAIHYLAEGDWNRFVGDMKKGAAKHGGPVLTHHQDGWMARWPADKVHKGIQRYCFGVRCSGLRSDRPKVYRLSSEAPEDLRKAQSASLARRRNTTDAPSTREWSESLERAHNTRMLGERSSTTGVRVLIGLEQSIEAEIGPVTSTTTLKLETETTHESGRRTEDETAKGTTWTRDFSGSIELAPHTGFELRVNWYEQTIVDRIIVEEVLDFGAIEFIIPARYVRSYKRTPTVNGTADFQIFTGKVKCHLIPYTGFADLRAHARGDTGPRAIEFQRRRHDFQYLSDALADRNRREVVAPRLVVHEEGVLFEEDTRMLEA